MTNQSTASANKPTHRLYCVEGEGKDAHWTEIGTAWPHKDGEGFALSWNLIPVSGRVVMRKITARPAKAGDVA